MPSAIKRPHSNCFEPLSTSLSIRSLAVSRPCRCCRSIPRSPPPRCISSALASISSVANFTASWSVILDRIPEHKKTRQLLCTTAEHSSVWGYTPVNPTGSRAQVTCSPLVQSFTSITDHLLRYVAMLNYHVPFDAAKRLILPTSGRHTAQGTLPWSSWSL